GGHAAESNEDRRLPAFEERFEIPWKRPVVAKHPGARLEDLPPWHGGHRRERSVGSQPGMTRENVVEHAEPSRGAARIAEEDALLGRRVRLEHRDQPPVREPIRERQVRDVREATRRWSFVKTMRLAVALGSSCRLARAFRASWPR